MNIQKMIKLCCLDVDNLKTKLYKFLRNNGYTNIYKTENYIIAEGDIPVCLLAHMDTVFPTPPDKDDFFYDRKKKVLWCPGGSGFDDRAGIYAILTIIERGYHPHIIFTNEEEVGGIGARKLVEDEDEPPFDCKALIQLDRAYAQDMVFYDCDCPRFEKYIKRFGFEKERGTFSDISIIAPIWGIVAVNLSIGYVDEHTTNERLYCQCCDATIAKVISILSCANSMPYFVYRQKQEEKHPVMYNTRSCLYCQNIYPDNIKIKHDFYNWEYYCCPECFKKYECDDKEDSPFGAI